MVAADVVQERFGRNGKQDVLKFLKVFHAGNLFARVGIAENKVAETEFLGHNAAQVHIHLFGILVDEGGTVLDGIGGVFRLAGLDDEGNKRIFLAYGRTELDAGQSVLLPPVYGRETYVGNDAQYVVLVFLINADGLFVVACQYNFRPPAHT